MLVPILIILIVGVLVGGLVNVLADDLPYQHTFKLPHYPDGNSRPVSAWLGLTAFLLGKRTSASGSKLSWRYPLVEIATPLAMILTYIIKVNEPKVDTLQMVYWLIYMAIFVLITVIDLEHKLILFIVIIPSAILAIMDALTTSAPPNLERSLTGGALGFGTFFVLYLGGIAYVYIANQVQGRNISEVAFGYGDVMMALLPDDLSETQRGLARIRIINAAEGVQNLSVFTPAYPVVVTTPVAGNIQPTAAASPTRTSRAPS